MKHSGALLIRWLLRVVVQLPGLQLLELSKMLPQIAVKFNHVTQSLADLEVCDNGNTLTQKLSMTFDMGNLLLNLLDISFANFYFIGYIIDSLETFCDLIKFHFVLYCFLKNLFNGHLQLFFYLFAKIYKLFIILSDSFIVIC